MDGVTHTSQVHERSRRRHPKSTSTLGNAGRARYPRGRNGPSAHPAHDAGDTDRRRGFGAQGAGLVVKVPVHTAAVISRSTVRSSYPCSSKPTVAGPPYGRVGRGRGGRRRGSHGEWRPRGKTGGQYRGVWAIRRRALSGNGWTRRRLTTGGMPKAINCAMAASSAAAGWEAGP